MTQEEILAAASVIWDNQNWTQLQTERLMRFAALVAAHEREQCAKLADEWAKEKEEKNT